MFVPFRPLREGYRGLALALTVALCAGFLSEHYGAPVMLFALLIGMAFNFLADHPQCAGGVTFASKMLLRMGVALLGFRLSLGDVAEQGWLPVVVIIALVALTMGGGAFLAPLFKRKVALGFLTGGATAICGASAALAISAVMPKREGLERDTLFTVVAVTTLSTIAMVLYPALFTFLGFDDAQAGFLIGATIHDVAQVVGAGFSISDEAGNVATLTKLQRVLLLPVVILVIMFVTQRSDGERVGLPLFVIAFVAFILVNSTGMLPAAFVTLMVELSRWMLITAIAALGIKTSLGAMLSLGGQHIALVVGQTLLLLIAAIAAMLLFL